MAQLNKKRIISCKPCIKESRINNNFNSAPLQNPSGRTIGPADATQINLVPALPPYGGYQIVVTAMGLSSGDLFAYPTISQDAETIARVIVNIITQQAYLPTTIICDKGSAFVTQMIKRSGRHPGIYPSTYNNQACRNNLHA